MLVDTFIPSCKSSYYSFVQKPLHNTENSILICRKISDFKHKIENSDYFQQSIEILSNETKFPITKIVCFGIGQIRQCNTSRYQLAYILALRSHLKLKSIQFHEPILNHHDGDLLNELHCELDPENVEGKVELDSSQTTLVFLPHCPKQLINNLLWKNWSAKALRRTILIGNSFRSIIQQTPISCVAQDAGFINQIERYTAEFSLRNSFEYKNIFNDISIHFFNTEHCEDNFFDICLEPSYDLSELIERFDSDLKISKNG